MDENADAAGETLGDFENVGGQDHRRASRDALGEQVLDLPRRRRVEAGQRLVEHEEFGLVDQRAGERDLLLHAARKALAALAAVPPQAERGEQDSLVSRATAGSTPHRPATNSQIFERIELVIEHRLVGQPGDDALGLHRSAARVDAENSDFAAVGRQQPGDHPERRRLAGPVGPDQRVEFSRANREVEAIDRLAAKAFGQAEISRAGEGNGATSGNDLTL